MTPTPGQINYESWHNSRGWKCEPWHLLDERAQAAWEAGAVAVTEDVLCGVRADDHVARLLSAAMGEQPDEPNQSAIDFSLDVGMGCQISPLSAGQIASLACVEAVEGES